MKNQSNSIFLITSTVRCVVVFGEIFFYGNNFKFFIFYFHFIFRATPCRNVFSWIECNVIISSVGRAFVAVPDFRYIDENDLFARVPVYKKQKPKKKPKNFPLEEYPRRPRTGPVLGVADQGAYSKWE